MTNRFLPTLTSACLAFTALQSASPAQSTNADLSDLAPSVGTLSPSFDSATIGYTVSVTASSITVTPTAADALATITVNGDPVTSGGASAPIILNFGSNVISTVVTAEDAVTTKTYTLTVTRTVPATIATAPVAYWPMRDGLPGATVPTTAGAIDDVIDDANHPATNATANNTNSTWQADPTRGIVWSTTEGNRLTAGQQGINLNTQTGWTWSVWAKISSSNLTDAGADVIMGSRNATWNKLDIGGASNWINPTFGAAGNPANDTWQHIVFVGDATGGSIYVNGVFQNKDTSFNGGALSTAIFDDPMEIGGSSRFSEDLTALMSDVAVWDVALTPTQIADLANGANVITDTTAPVLTATNPADDDTSGSIGLVQAIFDEPVFVGSGDIRIVNDTDSVTTTIAVTDAAQVTVSGASITLNPAVAFIPGKSYHIEMDSGVVKNAEGLDFAGIGDSTTWNFTVDNTPPTLVSIVDGVGGVTIGEDIAVVTYTVTFDEPMDGATVDDTVFDNAGTATVSIGTVTRVSPVVFTVEVLPSTTGTLQLRIPSGKTVTDTSGNALVVPATDDTTININAGATPNDGIRYWDGAITSGVTDGVSQGGSGIWSTANTNWDRGVGFEGPVAWNNANLSDVANFGGSSSSTITVAEDINLGGLNIANANTTTFNGAFTLNFSAGGSILHDEATGSRTATINQAITGAPSVTVAAGETLTFDSGALTRALGNIAVNPRQNGAVDNKLTLKGTSTTNTAGDIVQTTSNNGQRTSLEKRDAGTWTVGDLQGAFNARLRLFLFDAGRFVVTGDITSTEFRFENVNTTLELQQAGDLTTASSVVNPFRGTIDNTSGSLITFAGNPAITFSDSFTLAGNSVNMGAGATNLGTATRNITVSNAASTLTFGGVVSNTGGIIKLGDGALELTGANTYTGTTTVTAGTLALTGGSQASAITVQTGAALGLSPNTVAPATATTTSTAALTLDAGHTIKIAGTVDNSSDYLLMTASSITGTPALAAAITGYELQVLNGGTELWLIFTGTAGSPYATWANGFLPDDVSNPALNFDNDTLTNLEEFAFGTDPTVSSAGAITYAGGAVTTHGQPVLLEEGGTYYAVFGRRVDHVAAGLTYTVQFSADLSSPWVASAVEPTTLATDGVIDAVSVPFPGLIDTDSGPQKARFFRVQVSLAP